jgi:hypothetical protein
VPLAWKLLWEGFGWPLRAFAEFRNGSLLEDDKVGAAAACHRALQQTTPLSCPLCRKLAV